MLMDIEPFSAVDYPGHLAATIFFAGCNFRCGYCHNPILVKDSEYSQVSAEKLFDFLKSRKGLLDGVCLTGGEPLLSADMPKIAATIKEMGFKIKLDTNGSNLDRLQTVAQQLDYVAMDIKCTPEKYDELVGCKGIWGEIEASAKWLKKSGILYEFRTTVLPCWHTEDDLVRIREIIGSDANWLLQQFRDPPDGVLDGKTYKAYPNSWLKEMGEKLGCKVRGI
ncbi:MAG: anaerobic ribonucleoside-triphosphate reductase activating protein [Eubacteriales bacterium]